VRKLLVMAIKEVVVTFRDVGALVTMLLSPLLLTLAIGAAFGMGGNSVLADIPVVLVNYDQGQFSQQVISAFEEQDQKGLISLEQRDDESAARSRVNADEVAALVVIPEDFSQSILPLAPMVQDELGLDIFSMTTDDIDSLSTDQAQAIGMLYQQSKNAKTQVPDVMIYASPDYQISTSVVQGILRAVLEQINVMVAGADTIISNLVAVQAESGSEGVDSFYGMSGFDLGNDISGSDTLPIKLEIVSPSGRSFSWLDYSAASMAIVFLMFAVTSGGRSLLAERQMGTLPRLAITPTHSLTILVGKMAGIVLTGLLQVCVLWGTTSLIGAYWGPPLAVFTTLVTLVLAATGVGAVISAWSKSAGQAGAIGTAVTLVAAAASGSFFPRVNLPAALRSVSLVTPNAWGIEIFAKLQSGQSLVAILPLLGGLLALTVVYYAIAAIGFRRNFK
jgi:ABC-2 type transport system permease protein